MPTLPSVSCITIVLCWQAALSWAPIAACAGDENAAIQLDPPAWLEEAYWYHLDVPSFRNGDPSNDSPGRKGGDLTGLLSKLPYLKALGVNTLRLSGVFWDDQKADGLLQKLQHVSESMSAGTDRTDPTTKTTASTTWKPTAGDKLFFDFIKKAHAGEFRVVLDVTTLFDGSLTKLTADDEAHLWALTRRWMDPNEDGDTADGVDGWIVGHGRDHQETYRRWRARLKETNADAVLICDPAATVDDDPCGLGFDALVAQDAAETIRRFLTVGPNQLTAKRFATELKRIFQPGDADRRPSTLLPLGGAWQGKLGASPLGQAVASPGDDSEATLSHIRLGIALQHFLPAAPVIYFGDESSERTDLIALHRMLKKLRDDLLPLRAGGFEVPLADDDRQLVALARGLPGNQVIVVLNYGKSRQTVIMPAGRPGQLVGVLNPHLKLNKPEKEQRRRRTVKRHPDGVPMLPVTGTRQFVNSAGEIRFRIAPRSIRLILINDKEPR